MVKKRVLFESPLNVSYFQLCISESPTLMTCPSPRIPRSHLSISMTTRHRRSSHQHHPSLATVRTTVPSVEVELGFLMDNVASLHNLTASGVNARMVYHPDPIIFNFTEPGSIKKFKGEVLLFEVCIFICSLFYYG